MKLIGKIGRQILKGIVKIIELGDFIKKHPIGVASALLAITAVTLLVLTGPLGIIGAAFMVKASVFLTGLMAKAFAGISTAAVAIFGKGAAFTVGSAVTAWVTPFVTGLATAIVMGAVHFFGRFVPREVAKHRQEKAEAEAAEVERLAAVERTKEATVNEKLNWVKTNPLQAEVEAQAQAQARTKAKMDDRKVERTELVAKIAEEAGLKSGGGMYLLAKALERPTDQTQGDAESVINPVIAGIFAKTHAIAQQTTKLDASTEGDSLGSEKEEALKG